MNIETLTGSARHKHAQSLSAMSGIDTQTLLNKYPAWKVSCSGSGSCHSAGLYTDPDGKMRDMILSNPSDENNDGGHEIIMSDLQENPSHIEIPSDKISALLDNTELSVHVHPFSVAKEYHDQHGMEILPTSHDDPIVGKYPQVADSAYTRDVGGIPTTHIMVSLDDSVSETFVMPSLSKSEEESFGADSALKQGEHTYGKWKFNSGLHGPARAKERRPDWKPEDWHDLLSRGHEALTNPSKQIVPKGSTHFKLSGPSDVMIYSKSRSQGIVIHVSPSSNVAPKLGGKTNVITVPPPKASVSAPGTHRIVIEEIEILLKNIIIIE